MNSQKTTVIPFPTPSKNGLRYSAETEKQNNVIQLKDFVISGPNLM